MKYIWWWFKDLFRSYHPMTKEQVTDGNRKHWDDYYRQFRDVEEPKAKFEAKVKDDWEQYYNNLNKPKDERMSLFPPGQMPPELKD